PISRTCRSSIARSTRTATPRSTRCAPNASTSSRWIFPRGRREHLSNGQAVPGGGVHRLSLPLVEGRDPRDAPLGTPPVDQGDFGREPTHQRGQGTLDDAVPVSRHLPAGSG